MSGTRSFTDVSASLAGPTGGIDLGYGPANSGKDIMATMTEAKNAMTVSVDGEVVYSLHAGRSGTITVTLLKTFPVNKKLSLMYNAQSLSSTTWGDNATVICNEVPGDTTTAHSCVFQRQPDRANVKTGNAASWVSGYGKADQLFGEF